MKVMADIVNGVFLVDDLDDYDGEREILEPAAFYDALGSLGDEEQIASDLDLETAEKIIREYGIAANPGGKGLSAEAARAFARIGGKAKSEKKAAAAKANGAKGGRPSTKYKFTPYVLNGAGCWEYIEGGDWFASSVEKGFAGIEENPVAEDGYKCKIIVRDKQDDEIEARFYEVQDERMVGIDEPRG